MRSTVLRRVLDRVVLGRIPDVSRSVDTFCMFIGYPRSGHSLVGALLDAHEHAIIAHEANILTQIQNGLSDRRELQRRLIRNSQKFARRGRAATGYSYEVPGQWQGCFSDLSVIGDKKGGRSAQELHQDPTQLDRLLELIGDWRLKVLHVIRNPYDNLSTMVRHGRTLPDAITYYFQLCAAVAATKERLGDDVLDVHHEAIIREPRAEIRRFCEHLMLESDDAYVEACASIVYASPRKSREEFEWPEATQREIERRSEEYPWLREYTFEE